VIARILAFVVAIAMVGGALVYRASQDSSGPTGASGDPRVVCAAELGPVCDVISGAIVEPVHITADRLAGARTAADADIAAWLTPGPWAEMIDAQRKQQSKPALFGRPERLAHTALVAVQKTPPLCLAPVTWKCLGDAAQAPGAAVGADPKTSPAGLFIRAALLSGFFGRTDFASNDFEDAPGWLDNVERAVATASSKQASDLTRFLVSAPDVRVFLTTAQAAGRAPGLAVPDPVASVTVALAPSAGVKPGLDSAKIRDALQANGWVVGPPSGGDGLPSPGVLLALREVLK
jgi:hypothetical protein